MLYKELIGLFLALVLVAALIAKYQSMRGYTFHKSFIGTLIGLLGLAGLLIQFLAS
jgi:hypothetical protein